MSQKLTATWMRLSPKGDIPSERHGHSSILRNDKLYIFGGNLGAKASGDLFEYDICNNTWRKIEGEGRKPPFRYNHSMVMNDSKNFVIFGGQLQLVKRNDLFEYNFSTNTWTEYKDSKHKPEKRFGHSAITYNNVMFLFGGNTGKPENDLYQLDLNTYTWSPVKYSGDVPTPRFGHSSIEHQGKMYIFGGQDGGKEIGRSNKEGYTNSLYVLDLKIFVWSRIDLNTGISFDDIFIMTKNNSGQNFLEKIPHRNNHTMNLFGSNLIIFSGFNGKQFLRDLITVNIESKEWDVIDTDSKNTPPARMLHSSVVYKGRLFIFGGQDENYNNLNDLYVLQLGESPKDEETPVQEVVKETPRKRTVSQKIDPSRIASGDIAYICEQLEKNNPYLYKLKLKKKKLKDEDIERIMIALQKNKSLLYLDIRDNCFTDAVIPSIMKMMRTNKRLETLLLEGNMIGTNGIDQLIFALKDNTNLTDVTISEDCTDEDYDIVDKYLDRNFELNGATDLSEDEDSDDEVSEEVNLGDIHFQKKEEEKISSDEKEVEEVEEPQEILEPNEESKSKISKIDKQRVENADIKYILELVQQDHPELKKLHLNQKNITSNDIIALAKALENNTTVTYLNISENNLPDSIIPAISSLIEKNKSIETLEMHGNLIGDDGVKSIIDALEVNETITDIFVSEFASDEMLDIIDDLLDRNYLKVIERKKEEQSQNEQKIDPIERIEDSERTTDKEDPVEELKNDEHKGEYEDDDFKEEEESISDDDDDDDHLPHQTLPQQTEEKFDTPVNEEENNQEESIIESEEENKEKKEEEDTKGEEEETKEEDIKEEPIKEEDVEEEIPEWKKKLLLRKKNSKPMQPQETSHQKPEEKVIPEWQKKLLELKTKNSSKVQRPNDVKSKQPVEEPEWKILRKQLRNIEKLPEILNQVEEKKPEFLVKKLRSTEKTKDEIFEQKTLKTMNPQMPEQNANTCYCCGEQLYGKTVKFQDKQYLLDHFKCTTCKTKLSSKCMNIGGLPYCSLCGKKAFIKHKLKMKEKSDQPSNEEIPQRRMEQKRRKSVFQKLENRDFIESPRI